MFYHAVFYLNQMWTSLALDVALTATNAALCQPFFLKKTSRQKGQALRKKQKLIFQTVQVLHSLASIIGISPETRLQSSAVELLLDKYCADFMLVIAITKYTPFAA